MVSNMGAPLVGQERLADSRNVARAVEIQQELLGAKFRAVMSLEIGGGNGIQPIDGGGPSGPAGGRCRHHGPRLSRGADDQRRGRRAAPLSVRALRPARHRGGGDQGPELEMDGAGEPQDLRRDGLDRVNLQSAAHGRRGQGMGHPFHRVEGDRHRPTGARRHNAVTTIRWRRSSTRRTANSCSAARSSMSRGARPRVFCAAARRSRGSTRTAGRGSKSPFRTNGSSPGATTAPIAMSPDLICVARHRVGRGLRHRDDPLRKAGDRCRIAGTAGVPDAKGPRPCRPARLRLRPRLPLGVCRRSSLNRRRQTPPGMRSPISPPCGAAARHSSGPGRACRRGSPWPGFRRFARR